MVSLLGTFNFSQNFQNISSGKRILRGWNSSHKNDKKTTYLETTLISTLRSLSLLPPKGNLCANPS